MSLTQTSGENGTATDSAVVLVAIFQARPGKAEMLRRRLKAMLAPTRAEHGCLQYDLHLDTDDPHRFVFVEQWTDHAALAAHHATEHVRRLLDDLPHLLSQPLAQYRLTRLGT